MTYIQPDHVQVDGNMYIENYRFQYPVWRGDSVIHHAWTNEVRVKWEKGMRVQVKPGCWPWEGINTTIRRLEEYARERTWSLERWQQWLDILLECKKWEYDEGEL